jgi:nitroreductase
VPDIAALVADAMRAPSSHNTQPWLFAARDGGVALLADRTRALPVNDPRDRELTISCGAALFTLRLAARARGLSERTRILPDPGDPDLLAVVELDGGRAAAPGDAALLAAVAARRTHRGGFLGEPVSPELLAQMAAAVAAEGAGLELVDGPERRTALAGLVDEGDRAQFADPRWRRELAAWMHPRRRGDGLAVPLLALGPTKLAVRGMDLGPRTGAKDAALLMDAPAVAVLHTPGDAPADWLAAGQGLQAALLAAAAEGVRAGYLNQPCQVEALRPRLAALLDAPGAHPQVVMRLGRPDGDAPPAPRRPVADVLEEAAGA